MGFGFRSSASALVIAASFVSVSAFAQTAASADDSEGVRDIVVTAQRRSESLQSVNIAATAISGDDLGERAVVRQNGNNEF
jgi:iron complex outermembrane recepter protein